MRKYNDDKMGRRCNMTFAEELRKLKDEKGYTVPFIFKKTDIPITTLYQWLNGVRIPPEWCQKLVLEAIDKIEEQ